MFTGLGISIFTDYDHFSSRASPLPVSTLTGLTEMPAMRELCGFSFYHVKPLAAESQLDLIIILTKTSENHKSTPEPTLQS